MTWEGNSRNKTGISLNYKSTKVHILRVFLEVALFTLRADRAADNTMVVQNQVIQLLLPFLDQPPVTWHFLKALDAGHAHTTSPWGKEHCQKPKGEVRNRTKFLVAQSGQA